MDWIQAVDTLVKYSGASQSQKAKLKEPTPQTFVTAFRGWLDTEVTEYTEGAYEAVSRRIVWLYPDGYSLTVGSEETFVLSNIDKEMQPNFKNPIPKGYNTKDWTFSKHINGWSNHKNIDDKALTQFINDLSNLHGAPKMILPWESWIEQTTDDDEYLSYWEDKDESLVIRKAFYDLMCMLNNDKLSNLSPWKVIICEGDAYFSEYSDYSRFVELTSALEETGEWMVVLDEHCAACMSGTRKWMVEENPKLATAPEFVTWGQNSQTAWLPDGTFYADVWIDDFESEKFVKNLANQFGFNFEIPATEEDATGSITFD